MIAVVLGLSLGLALLLAFAASFGQQGKERTWRGYLDSIAAGIALGALFDLIPKALELASVLVAVGLRTQVVAPLNAEPDSFLAIGAGVISQAIPALGALAVLFLYMSGNAAPMPVEGRIVGAPRPGWRTWVSIPAAGEIDWKGIALITFGLGAHNLWLGQVRGALATNGGLALTTFLFAFGLIAALRGFALVGSLVDARKQVAVLLGCALAIGGAGVVGVMIPGTANSILLGPVPLLLGTIALPLALGRLLRVMQYDIGLSVRTTLAVVAALAVERAASYLLLLLAQGQF